MPSYLIKDLRLFPFSLSRAEAWGGQGWEGTASVSTVKPERSEKQLEFTLVLKVQACFTLKMTDMFVERPEESVPHSFLSRFSHSPSPLLGPTLSAFAIKGLPIVVRAQRVEWFYFL